MPRETVPVADPPAGLLRTNSVNFVENLAQTAGSMAPSGGLTMFIPLVFASAGNGTWLLFVPVAAGYTLLAANINVFTSRRASAGSFTTYAELGLGSRMGLLAGWVYLVALFFAVASCAPSVAFYTTQAAAQFGLAVPRGVAAGIVAASIAGVWWAARRDISLSTNLMLGIECLSLGTMVAIAILFVVRSGRWLDHDQVHLVGVTPQGMRFGAILAFMSLTGFESVTTLGEESKQPLKAIPRAILACIIPISLMYLTMAYVVVMAFRGSGHNLGTNLSPFDYLASAAGWPHLSLVVAIGITLSFAACMLGCTNAAARILFALARRGHFWARFGEVHPVNATPSRSIGLAGSVVLVLALVPLALGMSLDDCMAYGSQVASTGFVCTYILASLAAPFFLYRLGALRWYHGVVAASAVAIFGCALAASIYPVPPYPWNLLPYIYLAAVAVGVAVSLLHGRRTAPTVLRPSNASPGI